MVLLHIGAAVLVQIVAAADPRQLDTDPWLLAAALSDPAVDSDKATVPVAYADYLEPIVHIRRSFVGLLYPPQEVVVAAVVVLRSQVALQDQ